MWILHSIMQCPDFILSGKVRGEVCGIIPSLSQLKDAKMHNLNSCAYYRNIQLCLETREGTAGESVIYVCAYAYIHDVYYILS